MSRIMVPITWLVLPVRRCGGKVSVVFALAMALIASSVWALDSPLKQRPLEGQRQLNRPMPGMAPAPSADEKPAAKPSEAPKPPVPPPATKAAGSGGPISIQTPALSFSGTGQPLLGARAAATVSVTTPALIFTGTGSLPSPTKTAPTPTHVHTAPLIFTGTGSL